jgi:hypothetical protein
VTLDELIKTKAWAEAVDDPYFNGLIGEMLGYDLEGTLNGEAVAGMLNAAWALGNIWAHQDIAARKMQASTGRWSVLSDG